jgi:hypothetical protein
MPTIVWEVRSVLRDMNSLVRYVVSLSFTLVFCNPNQDRDRQYHETVVTILTNCRKLL